MKNFLINLFIAAILSGCENSFYESIPDTNPESLFEELWTTFNTDYAAFEQRNVDWQEQYEMYRPLVNSSTTDDELFTLFTQMLTPLDDGHVDLVTPNRKVWKANSYMNQEERDGLFDLDLIKEGYMNNAFQTGYGETNTFGLIGNIGYWHMLWISDNLLQSDEIFKKFKDADGLIIDLRNNGGGDMTYSFSQLGRLTDQKRFTHRF